MFFDNFSWVRPKFRPGVNIRFLDDCIEIDYKQQGCSIDVLPENSAELAKLFKLIQQGNFLLDNVNKQFPAFKEDIFTAISELDKLGLLTESSFDEVEAISGRQLYTEVIRFAERFKSKIVKSLFYQRLVEKRITRNELLGYALEYYHVVKLAPGLIGPALSHSDTTKSQKTLQNFLASELHHDRMLEKSLKAVDITMAELEFLQPLPMTFAICSTLGVLAKQHPLSFKASLFLFEQPCVEFNNAFLERCCALNLPKEFYQPIIAHSDINEEGKHDDISRALLAEVAVIAREEVVEVKKNIAAILEFMAGQDIEIVNYYGDKDNLIPRIWA